MPAAAELLAFAEGEIPHGRGVEDVPPVEIGAPRSRLKSRMSTGAREVVVESPPPDVAPTGSIEPLSMDLAIV